MQSAKETLPAETRPFLWRVLDDLRTDVRLALRTWRRNFGLAVVVTTILTVGIGISSTALTLINDEYFSESSDLPDPSFVKARLARTTTQEPLANFQRWFSLEDVEAIEKGSTSAARFAAGSPVRGPLGEDVSNLVTGTLATCNFFSVHGPVRPLLGRLFDKSDCLSGARVAVMSESLWRNRFGADPNVIGRVVSYNEPLTIVGVVPGQTRTGLWIPYTLAPAWGTPRSQLLFQMAGRLAPGHSADSAKAEVNVVIAQEDRLHPGRRSQVTVYTDKDSSGILNQPEDWVRLFLLLGVVTMIVLLVSANVVTLNLARAHARRHEIAIRLSLGAGAARLRRMLVTETLVLALVAAGLSAVIAQNLPQLLLPFIGSDPTRSVVPDWKVWICLAGITLLAALASGLTPAREALKVNTAESLKQRPGASASRATLHPLGVLVIAQISIAVAFLGGAGVFMRSYLITALETPGFDTRHTMFVRLTVWGGQRPEWPSVQRSIAGQVGALPGVEDVAFAHSKPTSEDMSTITSPGGLSRRVRVNGVSPRFFATLGIPLRMGRPLQQDDPVTGSVLPVVVSQRLATVLLPGLEPLGQELRGTDGARFSVVGVAADIVQPGRYIQPGLYFPLQPKHDILLVRFAGDPLSATARVSAAIRRAAPVVYGQPRTFQDDFDNDVEEIGNSTALVMVLGICALVLAVLGVFGTVSFAAQRRTKEMAIRAALGAGRRDILRALTAAPVKHLTIGMFVGLTLALMMVPAARSLQKDLHSGGVLPYAAAVLLVAAAAFAAMLRPAHRAMSADPIAALREE